MCLLAFGPDVIKKKIEKHVYVSEKHWWNREKHHVFTFNPHKNLLFHHCSILSQILFIIFCWHKPLENLLLGFTAGTGSGKAFCCFTPMSRWQRCEIAFPRKGCGTKYRGCRSHSITAELGDGLVLQLQRRWYAITPLTKTNRFSSGYKIDFLLWKTARGLLGEFWLKLNYWNSYKLQTIIKSKERPSSSGRTTLAWGA